MIMLGELNRAIHSCEVAMLRGRKIVRACAKANPKAALFFSRTVFSARMRFSSAPKTRLARAARNGRQSTLAGVRAYFELVSSRLRGRRPVRADRRLRADEKRIRAQSTILDKGKPKLLLLLFILVLAARSAHWWLQACSRMNPLHFDLK